MRAGVHAHRIATWLLLGAALGGAIAYTVLRGSLPSDGARIAFYGGGWSDAGIRIEPIDAPAAGLRAGDVVVAVAGRPMETWLRDAAAGAIPDPEAAGPIDYALERDGAALGAAA